MASFSPTGWYMDLLILFVVQLAVGRFRFCRWIVAFFILVLHDMLASVDSTFADLKWMVISAYLSSVVLSGSVRYRKALTGTCLMFMIASLLAGVSAISGIPDDFRFHICILACMAFLFLIRKRRHISCRWNIDIFVERDGFTSCFPALIDTGNRLHEQRSGLPVLIVEAGAMPDISKRIAELDTQSIRRIPYGVLGSCGELFCFRADRVLFKTYKHWIPAPECWVAVYPGKIPGRVQALAPPEFADAAEDKEAASGF